MFTYGQDIPLDDVVWEAADEPANRTQAAPLDYLFEYGKPIHVEDPIV